jgi:hypothetical protein
MRYYARSPGYSCPDARNYPSLLRVMGRGWAILEGGNRGNVLMRSAAAVRYGDLSDWDAI